MNKTYRFDEMKALFPDEWVLVANPETDKDLQVLAGEVLWHTKDRDESTARPSSFGRGVALSSALVRFPMT